MSEYFTAGATGQSVEFYFQKLSDSSPYTGLTFETAGLQCYARKGATGIPYEIELATQTVGGAWVECGFVEVDAVNMPGVCRFDMPNTLVDEAKQVTLYFLGADDLAPLPQRVDCRPLSANVAQIAGTAQTPGDLAALLTSIGLDVDALPSAASVATAVWAAGTRTLSGTLGSFDAIWTKIRKYFQLALRSDAAIVTDNATELAEINAHGGSGGGDYSPVAESLEGLGDAIGDIEGGGGDCPSLEEIAAIVAAHASGLSGTVTVPRVARGRSLTLIVGDDYLHDIARSIPWDLDQAASLPDFSSGWTVALHVRSDIPDAVPVACTGTIVVGTGADRSGYVESAAANSALLIPGGATWQLAFTKTATAQRTVLLEGRAEVTKRASA